MRFSLGGVWRSLAASGPITSSSCGVAWCPNLRRRRKRRKRRGRRGRMGSRPGVEYSRYVKSKQSFEAKLIKKLLKAF